LPQVSERHDPPRLSAKDLDVRACTPADEAAILALHRRGYGTDWSPAYWHWRGRDSLLGRPDAAGVFDKAGACVALFLATPVPSLWQGAESAIASASNVVIDPVLRGTMAGGRLLERVIQCYIDTFTRGKLLFTYGCAVDALTRVIVGRLRAEVLCDIYALVRDLSDVPVPAGFTVAPVDDAAPGLDELLRACLGPDPAGVRRDRRFLDWRFRRHPLHRYELLGARDRAGVLRGACVLRDGGWSPEILSLMDWFVPDGDAEAESALVAAAVRRARELGRARLVTMFNGNSTEFVGFQTRQHFVVRPTNHQYSYRSWHQTITREALFGRWALRMSDLEFL
jgi:hypothetical protein